jgi:uncharacterized protein (TIGR00255 family)
MKQLVSANFARGRIEIAIVQQTLGAEQREITLDQNLAQQYYSGLQQLQEALRLPGTIDLGLLLTQREILKIEEVDTDAEIVWALLSQGMEQALQALREMRSQEGAMLGTDLQARLQTVSRYVDGIRQRVPLVLQAHLQRLEERVAELFQNYAFDPDRLNQEAVLFAERSDVAEELTRLESHIQALTRLLALPDAIGRKSEFLLQEVNREVNTIASKSNDAQIAQDVVEIKSELERMREQIQNVE